MENNDETHTNSGNESMISGSTRNKFFNRGSKLNTVITVGATVSRNN